MESIEELRAGNIIYEKKSLAIQRGNTASLLGTLFTASAAMTL